MLEGSHHNHHHNLWRMLPYDCNVVRLCRLFVSTSSVLWKPGAHKLKGRNFRRNLYKVNTFILLLQRNVCLLGSRSWFQTCGILRQQMCKTAGKLQLLVRRLLFHVSLFFCHSTRSWMDPNPSESQNPFDVVTLSLDDQAYAGMFGAMTIHQCAEMCRHKLHMSGHPIRLQLWTWDEYGYIYIY